MRWYGGTMRCHNIDRSLSSERGVGRVEKRAKSGVGGRVVKTRADARSLRETGARASIAA